MAIVTTEAGFIRAITARDPEIVIANNIALTQGATISHAITIKGETSGLSLFWRNPTMLTPYMFYVSPEGTLTLEAITLDAENRNCTLVQLEGGTLIMNAGTILQNITSTTSRSAVQIGTFSTVFGGTFIMNGGLITGISSNEAVSNRGGRFTMNNDAEISGNTAAGITVQASAGDEERGTLTMTGRSRVTGNRSRQSGGGVAVYKSDVYIGVNEGDAPEISDNRPRSLYYGGGLYLSDGSTLTMRRNSKIRDNYTDFAGGGLMAQDTVITMQDNASIEDNVCDGDTGGGGVRLLRDTKLILEDNACVSGNSCAGDGGGIYMQPGAYLEMRGASSVFGNKAAGGAGIFMESDVSRPAYASIGLDNSSPKIYNNTASGNGGGIYIRRWSKLDLSGMSLVFDNHAEKGAGIFKEGALNVLQSPQVLDGLFFEDTSGNVPVIVGPLTQRASIQLESSGYVSPPNVTLVAADKSPDCEPLGEYDRAAWLIPPDFGPGYDVILNSELDQVLIVRKTYHIKYCHLYGAYNPNPVSYDIGSEFPIVLQDPHKRKGYTFEGWYDCAGEHVTEIEEGTTGDILLIAVWKEQVKLWLRFDGNAPNVCGVPERICAEAGKTVIIPSALPKKNGHCFMGWNTEPLGNGRDYAPNDKIRIEDEGITLYALWRPVCMGRQDGKDMKLYCPKKKGCCHNV